MDTLHGLLKTLFEEWYIYISIRSKKAYQCRACQHTIRYPEEFAASEHAPDCLIVQLWKAWRNGND